MDRGRDVADPRHLCAAHRGMAAHTRGLGFARSLYRCGPHLVPVESWEVRSGKCLVAHGDGRDGAKARNIGDRRCRLVGDHAVREPRHRHRCRFDHRREASRPTGSCRRRRGSADSGAVQRAAVPSATRDLAEQSDRTRDRAANRSSGEHLDRCGREHSLVVVLRNRVSAVRARTARRRARRDLIVHRGLHGGVHPRFHLADRARWPGRTRVYSRRVHGAARTCQRS